MRLAVCPPRATATPAAACRPALRRRLYSARRRAKGALQAGPAAHGPQRLAEASALLAAHHGSTPRQPASRAARRTALLGRVPSPGPIMAATTDPAGWTTVGGSKPAPAPLAASPFSPTPAPRGRRPAFAAPPGPSQGTLFGHSQARTVQVWDCGCGGRGAATNFMTRSSCVACQRPAPAGLLGGGASQPRTRPAPRTQMDGALALHPCWGELATRAAHPARPTLGRPSGGNTLAAGPPLAGRAPAVLAARPSPPPPAA